MSMAGYILYCYDEVGHLGNGGTAFGGVSLLPPLWDLEGGLRDERDETDEVDEGDART